MKKVEPIQSGQAGYRVKQFAKLCGFSRTALYMLPEHQKPKSVRIGRPGSKRSAIVIIESPREFLQRLALMQQEAA